MICEPCQGIAVHVIPSQETPSPDWASHQRQHQRMCKYDEACLRRHTCTFLHTDQIEQMKRDRYERKQQMFKTKLCPRGDDCWYINDPASCPFLHPEEKRAVQEKMYKTKMCPHGEDCWYHDEPERCSFLHLSEKEAWRDEKRKTKVCKWAKMGKCKHQQDPGSCSFLHPEEMDKYKTKLCKGANDRSCKYSETPELCPFIHPTPSRPDVTDHVTFPELGQEIEPDCW